MKLRPIAVLTALALLTGCAAPAQATDPAPAVPQSELRLLAPGPGSALNEQGFFAVDTLSEEGPSMLTFYDFEEMGQRVLCDAPDCTHDSDACPAACSGTIYLVGDTLLAMTADTSTSYCNYTRLERRSAQDGRLLDQRLVLDGWQSVTPYTDGSALYACLNGDLVRLDVSTGLETVLKRRFLTESRSPLGILGDRVLWDTTETDDPSTRVLSLMQDDYSLQPLFRFAQGSVKLLCLEQDTLYWADTKTGIVYAGNSSGESQPVTDALTSYRWVRAEDDWSSVQSWGGQVVDGKLLVDVTEPDLLSSTCYAVDLSSGEISPCPLTDYWNGYSHPVAVWAETEHGLLVSQHERVMRTTMGQDGGFVTYESDRTLYGFLTPEDFFAGRPEYRMMTSLSI